MTEFKVFKLSNYKFNTKSNELKNTVTLSNIRPCYRIYQQQRRPKLTPKNKPFFTLHFIR